MIGFINTSNQKFNLVEATRKSISQQRKKFVLYANDQSELAKSLNESDIEARKIREEAARRNAEKEKKKAAKQMKIDRLNAIPEDAEAGTVEEFMYKDGVKDILEKLDHDMVGLIPVKSRVREIAALLVVDKLRRNLGLDTSVPSLHMCFTGAPGTGKTTVAMRMGQILQRMGYCRSGHLVVATRDDLVGQYVGHTAPKTKEVLKRAMGGVLFIDEAYYLYKPDNERDYGSEAIEILLQVMENQRDELVVILAGYKEPMDKFYESNPGLSSRIANHIDFPDYSVDELLQIAKIMLDDQQYKLTPQAEIALSQYITKRKEKPLFANARSVKNALDRARMRQANRIFDSRGQVLTKKELVNLEAEDILQSTVFND